LSSEALLRELHSQLTPGQFEIFLSVLLSEMGFSEVSVTGRSGDRGIDLQATWTELNVPGLEVELPFKVQAKRYSPSTTLTPRYVRELRGTLGPGEWGLLITTARASSGTHEEGLSDRSRVISIIDGPSLIDLCKKYRVGMKPHYVIDLSSIQEEEVTPPTVVVPEITTQQILKESLQEDFSRIGTSSIYQSQSKTVIARYSQRYDRPDINYWYGTTAKDLERVPRYRRKVYSMTSQGLDLLNCTGDSLNQIYKKLSVKFTLEANLQKVMRKDNQSLPHTQRISGSAPENV